MASCCSTHNAQNERAFCSFDGMVVVADILRHNTKWHCCTLLYYFHQGGQFQNLGDTSHWRVVFKLLGMKHKHIGLLSLAIQSMLTNWTQQRIISQINIVRCKTSMQYSIWYGSRYSQQTLFVACKVIRASFCFFVPSYRKIYPRRNLTNLLFTNNVEVQ